MKKRGFTLVELLAVIVILAIIALISIPMVLNTIDKAKEGAAISSVYNYISAVETKIATELINNNVLNDTYIVTSTVIEKDGNKYLINLKGTAPTSGYVQIANGLVKEANLCINGYDVTYEKDKAVVNSKCDNKEDNSAKMELSLSNNRLVKYQFDSEDNQNGILKDLSGGNNNGQMNNVEITNDGIIFDGPYSNDYVSLSEFNYDKISYTAVFRISENTASSQVIIGNIEGGGCGIAISNNNLYGECHIGGAYRKIATEGIEYNKVYVATLTYDGTNLKFYVDNELIGIYTSTDALKYPDNSTIVMLGQNPKGNQAKGDNLEGSIYYIDLHSRDLIEEEINYLHNKLMKTYKNNIGSLDRIGLLVEYDYSSTYNTSSILKDLSGNGNNGTISGAILTDNGLLFDGSNDYVKIGLLDLPKFTYIVDFEITQLSNSQLVIGNLEGGGCGIAISNSTLYGQCHVGGAYRKIATEGIEYNKVYVATLTYDGTNLKFYVNNDLIGTYTSTDVLKYSDNSTMLMLGTNPNGSSAVSNYFNGYINSVKIYNRALSENEIVLNQ